MACREAVLQQYSGSTTAVRMLDLEQPASAWPVHPGAQSREAVLQQYSSSTMAVRWQYDVALKHPTSAELGLSSMQ